MGFRRAAAIDANQPEIVKALRQMGAFVLITSQLKNAFDILVAYNSKWYAMEIKDGTKPPSARKLSAGEKICKKQVEATGCTYYVVNSIDEAIEVILYK